MEKWLLLDLRYFCYYHYYYHQVNYANNINYLSKHLNVWIVKNQLGEGVELFYGQRPNKIVM